MTNSPLTKHNSWEKPRTIKTVKTPRQIVDLIKNQTQPETWSKELRDWYIAEIMDLVSFNLLAQREELIQKIELEKIYDSDDTSRSVINMHGYNDGLLKAISLIKEGDE